MSNRNNETTTRFNVDISELKKAMQDAKRQIQVANSEFKAVSSSMDNWSKSTTGLQAKLKQLDSNLKSQKTILKNLESQYEAVVREQGEGSAAADRLKVAINNQRATINQTERQVINYSEALNTAERAEEIAARTGRDAAEVFDELADNADEAGNAAEQSSGGFTVMKGALASLVADGIRLAIDALKDFTKQSIQTGMNFEASMSEVAAISGATGKDFELLENTAKEFGATTTFSASEAAQALKYMALAGWDAEKSSSALGGVLDLAAASGMDLAQASDMVTDYMSAFGMEAEKSGYFADLLAYAQSNANTSAEQLGEAFKNSAANLNAAGQDVETVTALLSMMANQGFKGSEAGTALTAIMRDLTKAMTPMQDETDLAKWGIAGMTDMIGKNVIAIGDQVIAVSDAEGNYRDLTDILQEVEDATNGMGGAERAAALSATFTADSTKGLNLLLNAGVGEARNFEWFLRGASTTLDGFSESATELGLPLNDMITAFEKAGIAGESLEDILQYAGGDASLFADGLNEACDAGYDVYDMLDELGISLEDLQKAMDNSTGTAKSMGNTMNDNLAGDVKAAQSALEDLQITAYNELQPALRDIVQYATDKIIPMIKNDVIPVIKDEIIPAIKEFISWIVDNKDEVIAGLAGIAAGFLAFNVVSMIQGVVKAFKAFKAAQEGATIAQWLLNVAMSANPIGLVVAAIAALVAAFVVLWNKSEGFRNFWIGLWENIKNVVGVVVDAVVGFFTDLWNSITNIAKSIWTSVVNVFSPAINWFSSLFSSIFETLKSIINVIIGLFKGIWEIIKAIFSPVAEWFNNTLITPVVGFFTGMWDKVTGGASKAWEKIKNIFSGVAKFFGDIFSSAWKKVKDVFSTGGKIFSGIVDGIQAAFKTMVNTIISGINKVVSVPFGWVNSVLNKIRNASFLGISPFANLWSENPISVPEIPLLRKGGILKRGQMGFLEGDGAEAVVPLEKNREWIGNIARELADNLRGGATTGSAIGSTVNNFYQTINSPKQLSRLDIYRQSKNLLGYAGGGL